MNIDGGASIEFVNKVLFPRIYVKHTFVQKSRCVHLAIVG